MRDEALRLINKALPIIDRHLTELSALNPLTGTAATTIQNYIKTLAILTKEEKTSDENLSDEDLLRQAKELLEESEDET